jgi:hypothetical protein
VECLRNRRQSTVPQGIEAIPRFAPSAAALGAASAQQILEEFRKDLEGVDLKATKAKPPQKKKAEEKLKRRPAQGPKPPGGHSRIV